MKAINLRMDDKTHKKVKEEAKRLELPINTLILMKLNEIEFIIRRGKSARRV